MFSTFPMFGRIASRSACCTPSSFPSFRSAVGVPFLGFGTPPTEQECCEETAERTAELPTRPMAVDIHEQPGEGGNAWVITANVPGFRKDEVTIELKESVLSIEAKRAAAPTDAPTILRRERRIANLVRHVRLPENAATDRITAHLADGVLTVTIPQVPEAKPRTITLD